MDIHKINVDESTEVMKELGMMSISTIVGFAKGIEILRRSGMQTTMMLDFFFDASLKQKYRLSCRLLQPPGYSHDPGGISVDCGMVFRSFSPP